MIDKDEVCVVIPAYPNGMVSGELLMWTRPFKNVRLTKIPDIVLAYNRMLHSAQREKRFKHWLFIDNDMRPGLDAEAFLEAEADIVGCRYKTEKESAWSKPTDFHTGFFRISTEALGKLKLPFVKFSYTEDHLNRKGCMCMAFQQQAIEAGLSIAVAGYSDHDSQRSWC